MKIGKRAISQFLIPLLKLKWMVLGFYYNRLSIQAWHLYRQSELFKLRWQELGLEFAEESFKGDARFFLWKAQQEPLLIRLRLFFDGLFGREHRAYYVSEEA